MRKQAEDATKFSLTIFHFGAHFTYLLDHGPRRRNQGGNQLPLGIGGRNLLLLPCGGLRSARGRLGTGEECAEHPAQGELEMSGPVRVDELFLLLTGMIFGRISWTAAFRC